MSLQVTGMELAPAAICHTIAVELREFQTPRMKACPRFRWMLTWRTCLQASFDPAPLLCWLFQDTEEPCCERNDEAEEHEELRPAEQRSG